MTKYITMLRTVWSRAGVNGTTYRVVPIDGLDYELVHYRLVRAGGGVQFYVHWPDWREATDLEIIRYKLEGRAG